MPDLAVENVVVHPLVLLSVVDHFNRYVHVNILMTNSFLRPTRLTFMPSDMRLATASYAESEPHRQRTHNTEQAS